MIRVESGRGGRFTGPVLPAKKSRGPEESGPRRSLPAKPGGTGAGRGGLLAVFAALALLGPPMFAQAGPGNPGAGTGESPPEQAARAKKPLTADEAVELAVRNNLTLEAQRVAVDTKKRKADLVWNQFIPSVDVRGTLSRDNEAATGTTLVPVDIGTIPGFSTLLPEGVTSTGIYAVYPYAYESPLWHLNASLSASLTLSLAMFKGIQSTRLDFQGGMLSLEKAKVQTERDVRKAYYSMLLLEQQVSLLRGSFQTAERQVNMAQANYRAGLAPRLTLLQAQVARDNLKPTVDQAESGLKLSMAQFAMSLGLPYDTEFELSKPEAKNLFIPLDVKELIEKASENKPEILEMKAAIRYLETARQARAVQLRTPYLALSWNTSPTLADAFGDWGTDNWIKSGAFSITLGMNLNSLFPFTTEGQALKDLDNQIRSQNIALAQIVRGTEIEIYNTVLSLERTRITAEAQSNTVEMASEAYRLAEQAYQAGLKDVMEVQNAELELRKARIGELEQQFTYLQGLIDLEYATGAAFGTLSAGN